MDIVIIGSLVLGLLIFGVLYYKERDTARALRETIEDIKIINEYTEGVKKMIDALYPPTEPPNPEDKAPPGATKH